MKLDLNLKIHPEYTALIIIDIQTDFASKEGFRGKRGGDLSQVDPMVDKLETLIPIAQKAGVLVLYTQQIYNREKLNDLQKEQYDLDGKLITCDPQTGGEKFYRIDPPPELVFEKQNFNIFSNPDFTNILRNNGIKTLVITGMDTIYCVETAIRNGYDLGYKIVVPHDLVAGNAKDIDLHNRTLELVNRSFGVVVSSEELQNIWLQYTNKN